MAFFAQALVTNRIELLRELVPNAPVIGILVNPNFPGTAAEVADGQAAARAGGMELQIIQATNDDDVEAAFADMEIRRIGALVVSADIFFYSRRDRIVALAARHAVPAIYEWREYVTAGGLVNYGMSITDGYRQAGNYVARILKGVSAKRSACRATHSVRADDQSQDRPRR